MPDNLGPELNVANPKKAPGMTTGQALGLGGNFLGTFLSVGDMLLGGHAASKEADRQAGLLRQEAAYQSMKYGWEKALRQQSMIWELSKRNVGKALQLAQLKREGALAVGTGKARIGKSGVAMEGSPTSALDDIVAQANRARATIEFNDAVERTALLKNLEITDAVADVELNFKRDALAEQASALSDAGKTAREASILQAGAGLLGSATDFYGQYSGAKGNA